LDQLRILLVDDHVVMRQGTRQLLEHEPDMQVVGEAGDGEEAVALASRLKPDVIVMDVAMPKVSGVEATRQIKQLLPSAVVLVLTGYDYDEYVFSLLEAGAAGYLLKDVSGDDLVSAIRAVCAGEPVLHPAVVRKLLGRFQSDGADPPEPAVQCGLSEREMEVLMLAAKGMSNKELGEALFISVRTVQAHMRSIFNKLGVGSRSEAVIHGLRKGWFSLDDVD
jgi:NarL family two-component system response regulator LiaR